MDSGAGVAEDDDELPRPVVVVAEGYDAVSEDHDEDVGDCGRGGLEGYSFLFLRGEGERRSVKEGGKEGRKEGRTGREQGKKEGSKEARKEGEKEGRKEGRTGKEGSRKTYS